MADPRGGGGRFGDNDMVHMELNHDAGTFKMSINEGEPWEVPSKVMHTLPPLRPPPSPQRRRQAAG